jgi:hypothetical protein
MYVKSVCVFYYYISLSPVCFNNLNHCYGETIPRENVHADNNVLVYIHVYSEKKYWNGDHQGEGNEADPNLPGRRGLEE